MNTEQAWLLFQRTGLPEAYTLYRALRERQSLPAAPGADLPAPPHPAAAAQGGLPAQA